jgi:hypothetical protein
VNGGGVPSISYGVRVDITQNGGAFVLDLLSSDALGKGFDQAEFSIFLNGFFFVDQFFTDLASAEAFFSNHLINVHCWLVLTVSTSFLANL